MITCKELKQKYLSFFQSKGHAVIPSASLIPEHDPTVLFTTAGMHPLVPYLLGQKHPKGKRIADVQKCIRTGDIDSVGDASHLTFFEMLGNWSLGDYFKKEAISWSFEFLTDKKWLGFDENKLSVTCFKGNKDAPKDEEAAKIWQSLGIPKERIFFLPKEDNWWGPAGITGPCGPDTEMFIDTGKNACSPTCQPGCSCGKYFEVWNDVFMQYNKKADGTFEPLQQKNVDTGMGVERTVAMMNNLASVYDTDAFLPIIKKIHDLAKEPSQRSMRIIADHVRAATFILGDERHVVPSNADQGYVLRRLIRRAFRHGKMIGIGGPFIAELAKTVIRVNQEGYEELKHNQSFILEELQKEEDRFSQTLENGLKEFEKIAATSKKLIAGADAFLLFQSFGFPIEMTKELAKEKSLEVDEAGFAREWEKHQELSRVGAEKRFKGGLADASSQTVKLHTATHLLNEALRKVLKDNSLKQKGSNITAERLRFDFNFGRKLTDDELHEVEKMVNRKINEAIAVERLEMPLEKAKKLGAQMEFHGKYPDVVSVYKIGDFSLELCGGPHVKNTKEVGRFKIMKEEAIAAGVRRIKATVT